MAKRDGFILHEKTLRQMARLSQEDAGYLLACMTTYYRDGEVDIDSVAEVSVAVAVILEDAIERMDADADAYYKSIEQRKNAAEKRWNNVEPMRNDAECMRNDAECMRNDAECMRNDAECMRDDAGGMRTDAEDMRDNAEPMRNDAVSVSVSDSVSVNKNILSGKPDLMPTVKAVIEHLNEKARTHYRMNNRQTVDKIKARLNEGFTENDLIKVIDNKVTDWMGTDMQKFLRPETLFGAKCESYLNEQPKARSGTRFQNFPQRTDPEHSSLVAKVIAMNTGG